VTPPPISREQTPMGSPVQSPPTFGYGGNDHSIEPESPSGNVNPYMDRLGMGAGGKQDLVVSLIVHVKEGLGDSEILDITRFVWGKVSGAIGGGLGGGSGEVCVGVRRGEAAVDG
jgi:hypothetical protein